MTLPEERDEKNGTAPQRDASDRGRYRRWIKIGIALVIGLGVIWLFAGTLLNALANAAALSMFAYAALVWRRNRHALRWMLLAVLVLIISVLGWSFTVFRYVHPHARAARGPTALWLAHTWVGDPHSGSEYRQLARTLADRQITDAFFHVGPLDPDGTIPPRKYAHARELRQAFLRYAPGVRVQAWIGQRLVAGGGPLDLEKPPVLDNVVATAERFLVLGFSGIHYDIEPIASGDATFLRLLRKTYAAFHQLSPGLTAQGVVSISAQPLEPLGRVGALIKKVYSRYRRLWSPSYYAAVAAVTDQIAVFTYGSAMPTDWLFASYVRWQAVKIHGIVPRATIFLGAPTYDEPRFPHDPSAENLRAAIRGVQRGLSAMPEEERRSVGIAIYADWTTDAREWETYKREWIGT